MEKIPQKESRKPIYRVAAPDARPCRTARLPVHRRTVVRLGTHGRASPVHGRASGARPAVHWCAGFGCFLPGVHGRAPLWHARALPVFCCSAVLDAPGLVQPLIFF